LFGAVTQTDDINCIILLIWLFFWCACVVYNVSEFTLCGSWLDALLQRGGFRYVQPNMGSHKKGAPTARECRPAAQQLLVCGPLSGVQFIVTLKRSLHEHDILWPGDSVCRIAESEIYSVTGLFTCSSCWTLCKVT